MRLFVGVRASEEMLVAAEATAAELRRRLAGALKLRWVETANLHFTVRFIGNVDENRGPAVLAALGSALPIAPFEIVLDGCGAFPPSGAPRVIWIGLAAGMPSLTAMHEEFNSRLAPLGFEAEPRAFSAHLTLARVATAPRSANRTVRAAIEAVRPRGVRSLVDSATVFESRLSPKGAVYYPLFDVPCAG